MQVFVTGAHGYIGFAVAKAFRQAGYAVHGLIRHIDQASALYREGIQPVMGDLKEPHSYRDKIVDAHILIHCAFEYSAEAAKRDEQTIATFHEVTKKSIAPKTILYTSGVWVCGNKADGLINEQSHTTPLNIALWRAKHEEQLLKWADEKFRPIIMRPGCVYGQSGSLTGIWFEGAEKKDIPIIGHGDNYWSTIHIEDLAQTYLLAAQREFNKEVLNITNGVYHTVFDMVAHIRNLFDEVNISHLSLNEAKEKYGPLWEGLAANQRVENQYAKNVLNWSPKHLSFIDEVVLHYQSWKAYQK